MEDLGTAANEAFSRENSYNYERPLKKKESLEVKGNDNNYMCQHLLPAKYFT